MIVKRYLTAPRIAFAALSIALLALLSSTITHAGASRVGPLSGQGKAPAAQATLSGSTFIYVIQPGDTLFAISRRFGVSVAELVRINNIANPNFIRAGATLIIVRPSPAPPPNFTVYVVQPGDNLFRIALRYGTTVTTLAVLNNIPNPNLIFIGQRLTVPLPFTLTPQAAPTLAGTPTPTRTSTPPTAGATAAPTEPVTENPQIEMSDLSYDPNDVTVRVGTTVTWTNRETTQIPHTVTSGTPGAPNGIFDSGTVNAGQSYQFTFTTAGTYPYYCTIHGAAMTGVVHVVP